MPVPEVELTAEEVAEAQAANVRANRPVTPPRRAPTGRATGSGTRTRTSSPKRATAPKSPPGPDYTESIMGILQIFAAPLTVVGLKSRPALADAATIELYGPGAAKALNDLAKVDPHVAAMLERVLQMGPYGLFFAALLPAAAQLATNHREDLLPFTRAFGAMPREELIAAVLPPEIQAAANPNGQHGNTGRVSTETA